jgi:hypothetical protein
MHWSKTQKKRNLRKSCYIIHDIYILYIFIIQKGNRHIVDLAQSLSVPHFCPARITINTNITQFLYIDVTQLFKF